MSDELPPGYTVGDRSLMNDEDPEDGPVIRWHESRTARLPVMRRIGWLTRIRWWWNNRRTIHVVVSEPSQDAIQTRQALLMPAVSPLPVAPLRVVPFSPTNEAESEKLDRVQNAVMFSITQHVALGGRRLDPSEIDVLRHTVRGALNQAREIGAIHANDGRRALDRRNTENSTRKTDPGPRSARRTLKRQVTEQIDGDELRRMVLAAAPPPLGSFDKK